MFPLFCLSNYFVNVSSFLPVQLFRSNYFNFCLSNYFNYFIFACPIISMMQLPIAVHELTHALQDQHHNLNQLIDMKSKDKSVLVRVGIKEG